MELIWLSIKMAMSWLTAIVKPAIEFMTNYPKITLSVIASLLLAVGVYKYVGLVDENKALDASVKEEKAKVAEISSKLVATVEECKARIEAVNALHARDLKRQKQLQTKCVDNDRFAKVQKAKPTLVTNILNKNAQCIVDHVGQTDGQCAAGKWVKFK